MAGVIMAVLGLLAAEDLKYKAVTVWKLVLFGLVCTIQAVRTGILRQSIEADTFLGVLFGVMVLLICVWTKQLGAADGIIILFLGACGRNCPYTGHISCGFTADGALRADSDDDWKSGQKDVNAGHSVCLSGSSLEGIVMQSSVATKKQFKRPGARVRASFTLENVFLIPLFTMIIVFLMGAGLYLHDNIIIKNALIQGTVILEKNILKEAGEEQTGKQQLCGQMQSYILEKAVMLENVNISFHVTGEEIEAECSARFQLTFVPGLGENICRKEKLKRSYPPDDIRRLRAVKKMLGDS